MKKLLSLIKSSACQYRDAAHIILALPFSQVLELTLNIPFTSEVFFCCNPSLLELQPFNILLGPWEKMCVLRIQIQNTFLSVFSVT